MKYPRCFSGKIDVPSSFIKVQMSHNTVVIDQLCSSRLFNLVPLYLCLITSLSFNINDKYRTGLLAVCIYQRQYLHIIDLLERRAKTKYFLWLYF